MSDLSKRQTQSFSFFDLSYIKNESIRKLVKFSIILFLVVFAVLLMMSAASADDTFVYQTAYESTKTQISLAVAAMAELFTMGATAHTAMKVWSYAKMGIKRT